MVCAPIHVSLPQQRSTCIVPWLGDTRTEMRDSRPTGAPLYSAARPGVADEEPRGRATVPCRRGTARRARACLFVTPRCRESLSHAGWGMRRARPRALV